VLLVGSFSFLSFRSLFTAQLESQVCGTHARAGCDHRHKASRAHHPFPCCLCTANLANPDYKGKWYAPFIDNPAYVGEWKAKQIPNPNFFEDKFPFASLAPMAAVAVEVRAATCLPVACRAPLFVPLSTSSNPHPAKVLAVG